MPTPIIDMHIHIASVDAKQGCKVDKEMRNSLAFAYMRLANGVSKKDLDNHFDKTMQDHIVGVIDGAERVDYAVCLAMDGVYNAKGELDKRETKYLVSNQYARKFAAANPKVLFGASINPLRQDWKTELEWCLDPKHGPTPALVKWLPNSQGFRADDARAKPFLRALAETGVPLLCHCGPEYAVPVVKGGQSLGAPEYLRPALDAGVPVIVAHCAAPFYPTDGDEGLTQLEAMFAETRRAKKSWRLYADVSAVCVLCRVGVIDRLLRLPQDRLILGSDYPVPVNRMPLTIWKRRGGRLSPRDVRENPLDLNVRQLLAMGFSSSILTRAAQEVIPKDALRKTRRATPRRRSF